MADSISIQRDNTNKIVRVQRIKIMLCLARIGINYPLKRTILSWVKSRTPAQVTVGSPLEFALLSANSISPFL
jgi:hypothetical protein